MRKTKISLLGVALLSLLWLLGEAPAQARRGRGPAVKSRPSPTAPSLRPKPVKRKYFISGGDEDEDDLIKPFTPPARRGPVAATPPASRRLLPAQVGGSRWRQSRPHPLDTRATRRLLRQARRLIKRRWYAGARRLLLPLVRAQARNLSARALLLRCQHHLGDYRGLSRSMRWLERHATHRGVAKVLDTLPRSLRSRR